MQQRAKQSEQKHTYTESAPAPPVSRASASASSADEDVIERDLSPFLTVLVTPKITFSLPRKPSWKVPDDIPQEELCQRFWPASRCVSTRPCSPSSARRHR